MSVCVCVCVANQKENKEICVCYNRKVTSGQAKMCP